MRHPDSCAAMSLVMIALAMCGTGCSRKDSAPQAEVKATDTPKEVAAKVPNAHGLPAGWVWIEGKEVPSVPASKQDLPVTVKSDDGVDVVIADTSRTIVGNDDIIMVMEALGLSEQVFAAPTSSRTEVGKNAKHHFLFNRTTGIEGIISLNGTLFVGNSLRRHSKLAQPLRDAGQAMVIVDELAPAPEKVRKIAAVFGHADEGVQLASVIEVQLEQARQIAAKNSFKLRVIHVSTTGGGGAPTVAGADTAAAELIRMAGGINVGDEAQVANYSQLSNEGIVAANPDVVLVTENDLQELGGEEGLWKAYPSLKLTPAGMANRVWVMPDLQIKVTSLACGTGAKALAEALAKLALELKP